MISECVATATERGCAYRYAPVQHTEFFCAQERKFRFGQSNTPSEVRSPTLGAAGQREPGTRASCGGNTPPFYSRPSETAQGRVT